MGSCFLNSFGMVGWFSDSTNSGAVSVIMGCCFFYPNMFFCFGIWKGDLFSVLKSQVRFRFIFTDMISTLVFMIRDSIINVRYFAETAIGWPTVRVLWYFITFVARIWESILRSNLSDTGTKKIHVALKLVFVSRSLVSVSLACSNCFDMWITIISFQYDNGC